MKIMEFVLILIFVLFMVFLIVGFNRQMSQKAKEREDRMRKCRRHKK
ncbi:TadE/TadG family type IV pilus assembly protein [Campylobacter sp.]|nr:hypothetical protein [Campylobacter sp.]